MSESHDWVVNDESQTRLAEAETALVELSGVLGAPAPPTLKRVDIVLAAVRSQLSRRDCDMVSSSMLTRLREALTLLGDQTRSAKEAAQQGQPLDTESMRARVDAIADVLSSWPPHRGGRAAQLASD